MESLNSVETESDKKVLKRQSIKFFDKLQSLIVQWNSELSLSIRKESAEVQN